jgi:large repetitive protein
MKLTSKRNLLFAAGLLVLAVAPGCKGFFVNPTVSSVSVSPSTNNLQSGGSRQLTATATNSDGRTKDVTGLAVWDSSDTTNTFVTVSSTGFVKALQNTTSAVTITAIYKGFSGTATVTVGQAITITCSSCSNNSISIAANGGTGTAVTLTSNVAANWSSSNSAIITVSGTNTTSPTASLGGTTGTVTITATGTAGGTGTLQITVTQ